MSKIKVDKSYYIYDDRDSGFYLGKISPIKLENLSDTDIEDLADKRTCLLQQINKNSIKNICPKAWETYQKAKKKIADVKKRQKKTILERQAVKRQKEVEAAKKLLKEEGIINE